MAGENTNNNNEKVIRLDDMLYVVLKHIKTLLSLAAIGLMVGVLISFAYYVRGVASIEYYVTASMAVTSTNANGLYSGNSTDGYNPNAQDIHLAEDITSAVIYVCKSDATLNAAAERLQLIGVTAEQIKPKLTLSQYEDTQIIEMTLLWNNEEEGKMILDAITEVAPNILIDTLKIGDVTIVNQPKVKPVSLSFINTRIVVICTMIGLFVGAAFYLLRFLIHPTYLHSEDIKDNYNLDILGEIPSDKNYFNTKVNSLSANDFSTIQEYFSACAHVLVYRLQDISNVCIYITSSAAQEGKSSITANLGYALAELGYRTLLMDMDVRNPSLASKFIYDRDDKHCLNSVYRGDVDVHDAIVKINSNLDILPTKLEDERMKLDITMVDIISSAKSEYDFVIIDTAPVGQVSDSLSLNQAADCAIFVVRQDQVWINTVSESISRLKKSGIALLGAIMNDTRGGSVSYYTSNMKQFADSPYVNHPDKNKKKKKQMDSDNESIEQIKRKRNKKQEKQKTLDDFVSEEIESSEEEKPQIETVVEPTNIEDTTHETGAEEKENIPSIILTKPEDEQS